MAGTRVPRNIGDIDVADRANTADRIISLLERFVKGRLDALVENRDILRAHLLQHALQRHLNIIAGPRRLASRLQERDGAAIGIRKVRTPGLLKLVAKGCFKGRMRRRVIRTTNRASKATSKTLLIQ